MVEVQKLEVFAFFDIPARPSAGIGVVEEQKLEVFAFFAVLARPCGDRRGRGAKTRGFLRFCRCPRNPLRRSAWSRCKNLSIFSFLTFPDEASAGIGVVEVLLAVPARPSAEIVRVKALSLWRRANSS